jgi:hypothetical protein
MIAVIDYGAHRPDDWKLPLFIHVFGAMVLVGAVALCVVSLALAWRNGSPAMTRLAYRSLLWVGLPAWIAMRAGAQWIYSKEGWDAPGIDLTWLNIGFTLSEGSLLFLIIGTVLAGVGARRVRRSDGSTATTLDRVALVLISIALLGYLVAIWAMTTKPT